MQKRKIISIIVTMALFLFQAPAMAGEMDILVEKLVEKGVLNKQDAAVILKETKIEAEKERTETIAATKDALMSGKDAPFMLASAIPSWITNTAIKGDLRLRYESVERTGRSDQHRGRYRFRLGFDTKVNDKVMVSYGLASGGGDPRSTNQTFTNSSETPDIRLDYAYATYKPFGWLQLLGGQMKNPLWTPGGSYLWDSDIRPQGVSTVMNNKVGGVELFMTTGFWILDEVSNDSNDPIMWVAQPGYKVNLGKNAYFKNAVGFYQYHNVKGAELDYSGDTNTRDAADLLAEDYDAIVVSGELGTKTGIELMPFASVYAEYVNNHQADTSEDSGYGFGVLVGHEKVKKGLWQAGLSYHRLERDAWLDILPDSDTFNGGTNFKAIIGKITYGLMDNVDLGACYISSESIEGASRDDDRLQVDLVFKF